MPYESFGHILKYAKKMSEITSAQWGQGRVSKIEEELLKSFIKGRPLIKVTQGVIKILWLGLCMWFANVCEVPIQSMIYKVIAILGFKVKEEENDGQSDDSFGISK